MEMALASKCRELIKTLQYEDLSKLLSGLDLRSYPELFSYRLLAKICLEDNIGVIAEFEEIDESTISPVNLFHLAIACRKLGYIGRSHRILKSLICEGIVTPDILNYYSSACIAQRMYIEAINASKEAISIGCTSRWSTYHIGKSIASFQNKKQLGLITKDPSELPNYRHGILLICRGGGYGDMIWSARAGWLYKHYFRHVAIIVPWQLENIFNQYKIFDEVYSSRNIHQSTPFEGYSYWDSLPTAPEWIDSGYKNLAHNAEYLYSSKISGCAVRIVEYLNQKKNEGYLIVGLTWRSGVTDPRRTFSLTDFSILAGIPNIMLISLQKGGNQHIERRSAYFTSRFADCQDEIDELNDFVDTAAIANTCHASVTVDTSVAHLLGSIGAKAFVLVPINGDIIYYDKQSYSSSYSSLKLVRFDPANSNSRLFAISQIHKNLAHLGA